MPTGEFGEQKSRYLRWIGKGLVEVITEPGNNVQQITIVDIELAMIGAEVSCDRLGMNRFVEVGVLESNRESAHRVRAVGLHQCGNERRINAAGKKRANRNVGKHAAPHSVSED